MQDQAKKAATAATKEVKKPTAKRRRPRKVMNPADGGLPYIEMPNGDLLIKIF